MSASWDVYGRKDVGAWCIGCIVVSLLNIYTVSIKNVKRKRKVMRKRKVIG
jgi:hypothetical protein